MALVRRQSLLRLVSKTVTYYQQQALVRRQNLPQDALAEPEAAASKCDTSHEVLAVSHGWLVAGHADATGARKKDVSAFGRLGYTLDQDQEACDTVFTVGNRT